MEEMYVQVALSVKNYLSASIIRYNSMGFVFL
jgi:hypothetical protein